MKQTQLNCPPPSPTINLPSDLLTVEGAAERIGVHPTTMRRWVSQGIVRGVRIGKTTIRVDLSTLQIKAIGGMAA